MWGGAGLPVRSDFNRTSCLERPPLPELTFELIHLSLPPLPCTVRGRPDVRAVAPAMHGGAYSGQPVPGAGEGGGG